MSSDQMLTKSSSNNNNNNTATTSATSPFPMQSPYPTKPDNSRVVLTLDKGVAMVIMDQEDYTNKAQTLLQDTNTYKVLPKDPTSQLKKQTHFPSEGHQTNRRSQHQQV